MNNHLKFICLLTLSLSLYMTSTMAQDDIATVASPVKTDTEEATLESEDVPAGQEVEINEDNYRQFMELKDARQQRDVFPETAYKSQAGMQKLDKLPEDSQKHLRNQLREIIVQGDQWQPGDEDTDYPYVPSEAANTNPSLQKQEAEAWDELVDGYNQREAETYASSSRAGTSTTSSGAQGEGSDNSEGSGSDGQSGEGQQPGQQDSSEQSGDTGSYSANPSNDANATSTAGISQNAMEFLQKTGSQLASGENNDGPSGSPSPAPQNELETDSTTGTSQNALEFLINGDNQTGQTTDGHSTTKESGSETNPLPELPSLQGPASDYVAPPANPSLSSQNRPETDSTTGTSQNALEYLINDESEGTLSIEDLLNAQGVDTTTISVSPSTAIDEEDP